MKRLLVVCFCLLAIPNTALAQKDIFLSPKFNELSKKHKVLAIVPFKSILDLSSNREENSEEIEGKAKIILISVKKEKNSPLNFRKSKPLILF